jgi:hypothetical protein
MAWEINPREVRWLVHKDAEKGAAQAGSLAGFPPGSAATLA